jgi:hypothetical protein
MINRFREASTELEGGDAMSGNRFAAMFDTRSEPGNLRPLAAAFVPYPTGFSPNAHQQWVYQKAYEQALEEVALMARRQRMFAFSLN